MVPQAHKVANSLDYDKRENRIVRIEGDNVEVEAKCEMATASAKSLFASKNIN